MMVIRVNKKLVSCLGIARNILPTTYTLSRKLLRMKNIGLFKIHISFTNTSILGKDIF